MADRAKYSDYKLVISFTTNTPGPMAAGIKLKECVFFICVSQQNSEKVNNQLSQKFALTD